MINEMIRITYMVFRNANYKYIRGDLIIHTSTYMVWFLKYKYIQVHAKTQYTCNVCPDRGKYLSSIHTMKAHMGILPEPLCNNVL